MVLQVCRDHQELRMEDKKPRKSLRRLPKSLQSLLGLKTYLTPKWIESVSHIIKDLPSSPLIVSEKIENHDSVSNLCGDIAQLNKHLNQLSLQRRQALNEFLDLKGNIRVFCRVRPLLDDERYFGLTSIISSDSSNLLLKISETKSKQYVFDRVFHSQSTQEQVFSEIEPLIKSALDGYNVCIFAYGQTGMGKTFTMEGNKDSPGLVPRGIKALFQKALESNLEYMFTFSMLEIYMGRLRDLLVPRNRNTRNHNAPCLSIQMDPNGDVDIEKLTSVKVSDLNQVEKLYKLGTQLRSTASTMSNSTSSRSHCLTRITITCIGENARRRETSKMWMVDLGGSERLLKTQASGRRLQEGKAINLSLSALGDVISALQSKKHQHVPYRNSKLTQVLRDSLGTDSKTLMLVHVSPKEEDLCETVCSLNFAMRVKSVHLACDEPADVRAKREEKMAELQEKLKYYETNCRIVQGDIDMLKERLRRLDRNTETTCIATDTMQFDGMNNAQNVIDSTTNSKSQPGFMRPTVSSQRKMGMNYHMSVTSVKKPPMPSKRKSSSVYAESAGDFQSDYGSEYSTVTISDWKNIVDDQSECSQSASEKSEIKNVILQDTGKSIRDSRASSSSCESSNGNMANWLDLQMTKKTSVTASVRTKRVLAIRFDEQNSSMIQSKSTNDSAKLNSNRSIQKNIGAAAAEEDLPVDEKEIDEFLYPFKDAEIQESNQKQSADKVTLVGIESFEKPYLELVPSQAEVNPIDQNEENRNEKGTQEQFPKTIQILWTSAMLGLGITSLGYEHDFFHGLML
ncbi:putative minus-end-directed kinesin ATPase [Dioscorea sansibarensis]